MPRLDAEISDQQKRIVKALSRLLDVSQTDLIRMLIDNLDPKKEVRTLTKDTPISVLDRKAKEDQDGYWMDYSKYALSLFKIDLSDPRNQDKVFDIDLVLHLPIGQSIADSFKKISDAKMNEYQDYTKLLARMKYLNYVLTNIGNNLNQIARALNTYNKNHPDQKLDLNAVNSTVKKLQDSSKEYEENLDKLLNQIKSDWLF